MENISESESKISAASPDNSIADDGPAELGFVSLSKPGMEESSCEDGSKDAHLVMSTDMVKKIGNGESILDKPNVMQETADGDSDPSEPVILEISEISDLDCENIKLQGAQIANGVSETSCHPSESTDMVKKIGNGESLHDEPNVMQETADGNSDPSEPVILEISEISDLDCENIKLQGAQIANGVSESSSHSSESASTDDNSVNGRLVNAESLSTLGTIVCDSDSSEAEISLIGELDSEKLKPQGSQMENGNLMSSDGQSKSASMEVGSGNGRLVNAEPLSTLETNVCDSDSSEAEISVIGELDSGKLKPQGSQIENGNLTSSDRQSKRVHGEMSSSGSNTHDGVSSEKRLITSLTPLDEAYRKAVAEKGAGDLLFVDTQGSRTAAAGVTNSSDPIVIDLREDGDMYEDHSNKQDYREQSDSSVSELSAYESDSDIEIEIEEIFRKGPHLNSRKGATTHKELTLKDLPPIEDLKISVPEGECLKVGTVSSIVNELVVVQALPNTPALDLGTVLFLESGKVTLGEVFDVFGQVKEPYYTVRFNSADHARNRGAIEGAEVFCAPKTKYTSYVFVYEMLKMKGSDASWEHNQEPPEHCIDFSDDEEERAARKQKNGSQKRESGRRVGGHGPRISSAIDDEPVSVEPRPFVSDIPQAAGPCSGESSQLPRVRWTSKPTKSSGIHWRDVLQKPMVPAAENHPSNSCSTPSQSRSALHPPGHPPLRNQGNQEWMNSESALRAARRVNLHLYRNQPMYPEVLAGTYPPPGVPVPAVSQENQASTTQSQAQSPRSPQVPPETSHLRPQVLAGTYPPPRVPVSAPDMSQTNQASTSQSQIQGPRSSLLVPPETLQLRPPLLPSPLPSPLPNHWPFVSGPLNPFSPVPPYPTQSASQRLPSSWAESCSRPPPTAPSQIRPLIGLDHPMRRFYLERRADNGPAPMVSVQPPLTSSPINGLPYASRLNNPPNTMSILSSLGSPYERRNSVPPSLPPPSQPPFISSGQMRPFMLRPSSLFPRFPPNSGT